MPEHRSFSQPPRQPRPLVRITFLVVLVVGLLAVINVFINPPQRQPSTASEATTAPATDPTTPRRDGSPLTGAVAMIDQPLTTEPAGLPAWPGEGATRGFGFRRPTSDVVDEVVTWQLPADAEHDSVVAFYDAAASAMKFDRATATSPPATPGPTTIIYRRASDAGMQTLTLRLHDSPDGLRFTLWFQYPMTTQAESAISPATPHGSHE